MTTGIADYARWQQMFEGRLGKDDPPFRRGRIGRNESAAPKPEKVRRVFDDASSAWVYRRVFPRPGPGPSPGGAGLGRRIPGRDGEVSTTGGPTGAETVSGGSYAMGLTCGLADQLVKDRRARTAWRAASARRDGRRRRGRSR